MKKVSPAKEAFRLTKLWQDQGPNIYPLDIGSLIDGAILNSGYSGELRTRMGRFDSFEGCLSRADPNIDSWVILLNDAMTNIRRMRFTHAHELGHFMCHRFLKDHFEDNSDTLNNFEDKIETEANTFASYLLIPANVLRIEFEQAEWTTETLRAIGRRFECSLQASAIRYVRLSAKAIAFVVSRDGYVLWACRSETAPYIQSYRCGDELPPDSAAQKAFESREFPKESRILNSAWNADHESLETQYFDASGRGYQYTCIAFQ